MKIFKRKNKLEAQPLAEAGAAQELPEPAVESSAQPEPPVEATPGLTNDAAPQDKPGIFGRLRRGLGRTSDSLVQGLGNLFLGRKEIDEELLEELESRLLMADVGIEATMDIIDKTISIVVYTIARDFLSIHPHVSDKIWMGIINARINYSNSN